MKKTKLNKMFVYGTLVSKSTREHLALRTENIQQAVLHDFRKEGLNILKSKGDHVIGLFFLADNGDLEAMDRYEGIPDFYHRMVVTVDVEGKKEEANVYQLNKR